ncbi:MAG: ParB/RepB/Spo0J family partition protein [Candidatus Vogelbacteria bacterium]|nr:ParB/RepB/Spo0J family partition protein [Candidatus Vogelbacteria bacterium]
MQEELNKNNISQSVFWIEVEKIKPNPYQPRREFDQAQLQDLAESIRQYGVLQPLVATRKEFTTEDGGLAVEYELIAGERRLRASKLAGVLQVPVVIRTGEQSDLVKLELAIIENIQREDLNPVDRARAFQQLVEKFNFKHGEIAKKVGKSREYVSNSIRIIALPLEVLDALSAKKITEGHCRPLLMLIDRPDELMTLFKEIMYKKLSVREAENISRKIAVDRVRKKDYVPDPELAEMENKLMEKLGTRVQIERKEFGGRVTIDFFTKDDVRNLLDLVSSGKIIIPVGGQNADTLTAPSGTVIIDDHLASIDDIPAAEVDLDDPDLYSLKNFTV